MTDRSPQSEFDTVDYIGVTRDTYARLGYTEYRWADNPEPVPLAPLRRPVTETRLALIASGGVYEHGQVGFTHRDDVTHREIETTADIADIRVTHFAYDQSDARTDPNVVFPLEPLRYLVAGGELGSLTSHALTFMGGIYSQRRVHEDLAPPLVRRVHEMDADAVLLVPV